MILLHVVNLIKSLKTQNSKLIRAQLKQVEDS
jgi:hypothetical protein